MISMLFCRSAETVPECASEEKEATENNQKSHPKSHSQSSSSSSSTQKKNDCDIKTEEVKANIVPPGVTAPSLCSSPSDDTNPASTLSSSAQASSEEASSTSISSSAKEKARFLIQCLLQ